MIETGVHTIKSTTTMVRLNYRVQMAEVWLDLDRELPA